MKTRKSRMNTRLQILVPMCAFVLVVLIVLAIIIPSTKDNNKLARAVEGKAVKTEQVDTEAEAEDAALTDTAQECKDPAINEFFTSYYNALAEGDASALAAMYDSNVNMTSAEAVASLVERYDHLRVYAAKGINDNEIAAFVYSDVKFNNIESSAPSVDSFYLVDKKGDIKIKASMYTDPAIAMHLNSIASKDPIKAIMESTEDWLENTLNGDEELNQMFKKMQDAISAAN